ncbi:glycosyltransferase [Nocardia africana]|uniref:Transcriptional regulator BetI n=1 Tax=Nocardia africana TaxID=134964 RepID=A0A378X396_9NOCA|nr:glycosyltransferase [Nocardia africana]SUA48080.1 transcriptional regulator BetI [Nocardia africana]
MGTLNLALCEGLVAAGHEVTVLPRQVDSEFRVPGVRVYLRDEWMQDLHPEHVRSLPDSVDMVVVHVEADGLQAALAAEKQYPAAKIVAVHHLIPMLWESLTSDPAQGRARVAAGIYLSRRAHLVTGLGPALATDALLQAAMAGHGSVHELQPVLDMAEQPPQPAPGSPVRVLLFGRVDDALKGGAEIAEVVSRLRAHGHDVRLVVRGFENDLRAAHTGLAEIVGDPDAVEVLPHTRDRAEIRADIRAATVVVMPSRAEGFGSVATEAIEQGVPVVVPSTSGAGRYLAALAGHRAAAERFNLVKQDQGAPVPIDDWVAKLLVVIDDVPGAWTTARRLQELVRPLTRENSARMLVHATVNTDPHARPEIRPSRTRVSLAQGRVVARGEEEDYLRILAVADAMETDPAVRSAIIGRKGIDLAPSWEPLSIRLAAADPDEWMFAPWTRPAQQDDSRARILGATVATVAEQGFAATTIDDICRRAEVTPEEFDEHFPRAYDAFAAAHKAALDDLRHLVVDEVSLARAPDRTARMTTVVQTYTSALTARPVTARVVLVERSGLDLVQRAARAMTATKSIATTLAEVLDEPAMSVEGLRALAAAVQGLLANWAVTADKGAVTDLQGDLADLLRIGTASPEVRPVAVPRPPQVQSEDDGSTEQAEPDERERILTELLAGAARYGYTNMSLDTVQQRAGVSAETYQELFSDKESGFEAACAAAIERLRTSLRAAVPGRFDGELRPRLETALRTYLTVLASSGDETRVLHLELPTTGPLRDRFLTMVAGHLAEAVDEIDDRTGRLLAAAVTGVVADRIAARQYARFHDLPSADVEAGALTPLPGDVPIVAAWAHALLTGTASPSSSAHETVRNSLPPEATTEQTDDDPTARPIGSRPGRPAPQRDSGTGRPAPSPWRRGDTSRPGTGPAAVDSGEGSDDQAVGATPWQRNDSAPAATPWAAVAGTRSMSQQRGFADMWRRIRELLVNGAGLTESDPMVQTWNNVPLTDVRRALDALPPHRRERLIAGFNPARHGTGRAHINPLATDQEPLWSAARHLGSAIAAAHGVQAELPDEPRARLRAPKSGAEAEPIYIVDPGRIAEALRVAGQAHRGKPTDPGTNTADGPIGHRPSDSAPTPLDVDEVLQWILDSPSTPVHWQHVGPVPDDVLLASAADADVDLDAIRRRWDALAEDYVRSGWRTGGGLVFRGDTRPFSVPWADGFVPLSQRDGKVVYTTVRVNRAGDYGESVVMDTATSQWTVVHRIYVIDAPGGFGVVDQNGDVVSVHWPGGLRSDRIVGCFEIPAEIWQRDFTAQADRLRQYWRPNPAYRRLDTTAAELSVTEDDSAEATSARSPAQVDRNGPQPVPPENPEARPGEPVRAGTADRTPASAARHALAGLLSAPVRVVRAGAVRSVVNSVQRRIAETPDDVLVAVDISDLITWISESLDVHHRAEAVTRRSARFDALPADRQDQLDNLRRAFVTTNDALSRRLDRMFGSDPSAPLAALDADDPLRELRRLAEVSRSARAAGLVDSLTHYFENGDVENQRSDDHTNPELAAAAARYRDLQAAGFTGKAAQKDVAKVAGTSQSKVSQILRRRAADITADQRIILIAARWLDYAMPDDLVRAAARYESELRSGTDRMMDETDHTGPGVTSPADEAPDTERPAPGAIGARPGQTPTGDASKTDSAVTPDPLPADTDPTVSEQRLAGEALAGLRTHFGPDADERTLLQDVDTTDVAGASRAHTHKVAQWWHAMSTGVPDRPNLPSIQVELGLSDRQYALLRVYPHAIGNADGIPFRVRDKANRLSIARDIRRFLQRRPEVVTPEVDAEAAGIARARALLRRASAELQARIPNPTLTKAEVEELGNLLATRRHLREIQADATRLTGHPVVQLLAYDAAAHGGNGRVILSIGDADRAGIVNRMTNGLGSTVQTLYHRSHYAQSLYEVTTLRGNGASVAAIVDIGYRCPVDLSVASPRMAEVGGDVVARDITAFNATREFYAEKPAGAPVPRLRNAIGHSYGSTTLCYAAQDMRLAGEIDQAILTGSPGAGRRMRHAGEFGVPVYVLSEKTDPVANLGAHKQGRKGRYANAGLGTSPAAAIFGAILLTTEVPAGATYFAERPGPAHRLVVKPHASYYLWADETERVPGRGLDNLGWVFVGRAEVAERAEYPDAPRPAGKRWRRKRQEPSTLETDVDAEVRAALESARVPGESTTPARCGLAELTFARQRFTGRAPIELPDEDTVTILEYRGFHPRELAQYAHGKWAEVDPDSEFVSRITGSEQPTDLALLLVQAPNAAEDRIDGHIISLTTDANGELWLHEVVPGPDDTTVEHNLHGDAAHRRLSDLRNQNGAGFFAITYGTDGRPENPIDTTTSTGTEWAQGTAPATRIGRTNDEPPEDPGASTKKTPVPNRSALTDAEIEVLALLRRGMTDDEIAMVAELPAADVRALRESAVRKLETVRRPTQEPASDDAVARETELWSADDRWWAGSQVEAVQRFTETLTHDGRRGRVEGRTTDDGRRIFHVPLGSDRLVQVELQSGRRTAISMVLRESDRGRSYDHSSEFHELLRNLTRSSGPVPAAEILATLIFDMESTQRRAHEDGLSGVRFDIHTDTPVTLEVAPGRFGPNVRATVESSGLRAGIALSYGDTPIRRFAPISHFEPARMCIGSLTSWTRSCGRAHYAGKDRSAPPKRRRPGCSMSPGPTRRALRGPPPSRGRYICPPPCPVRRALEQRV